MRIFRNGRLSDEDWRERALVMAQDDFRDRNVSLPDILSRAEEYLKFIKTGYRPPRS